MYGIEILSLCFTTGVAAGAALLKGRMALGPVLIPLAALPCFFGKKLIGRDFRFTRAVFLLCFFLLGMAVSGGPGLIGREALPSAARLRSLMDSIPFPWEGTAPLLKALLTGDRSGLSAETLRAFREAGASHLLALSGLHLGIIYMVLDKAVLVFGRSPAARYVRFAAVIGAVIWFTLMTGAGPSIVRAALFIVINETLRLTLRPRRPVRVLCLALLIQLLITPEAVSSLGFQLSYLAMAGIFILYPEMEKWYPDLRSLPGRIWKGAALSISCQIFTAPLVWIKFHTFPRYFLITNLLALPLTTAVVTCGILTTVLYGLGICPPVAITVTDGLCRVLTGILEIIASLP